MSEATKNRSGGIGGMYLRRRYMVLFYSLLLTMVTVPASGVLGIDPVFIDLFLAANLLIAVIPLETRRARRVLFFILMILSAARIARIRIHDPTLFGVTLGMWTIVGLLAAAGALRFAMYARFVGTGDFSRMSAIYFSFVTLATLGYGDIVPRTDVARGLAIVEGVGGQLFLAVLVARLVSLYTRDDAPSQDQQIP